MKLFILSILFIGLISCRAKQDPSDYNITTAVKGGGGDTDSGKNSDIDDNDNQSGDGANNNDQDGEGDNTDTTGNGDGTPPGGDQDPPYIPPVTEVKDNCQKAAASGRILSKKVTVSFPAAIECQFNEGADPNMPELLNALGNGPRKNQRVRARVEDFKKVKIDKNSIVCDADFIFPEQRMQYDDEIFLTLNNYVLMASTDYSTNSSVSAYQDGLKVTEQGLVQYKWHGENGLYNLFYDQNLTPKYCLGVDPTHPNFSTMCNIPKTETLGQMKLDIPSDKIIEIGVSALKANSEGVKLDDDIELSFGFITTGDNDNGDCEHSAYSFDVDIKYIDSSAEY